MAGRRKRSVSIPQDLDDQIKVAANEAGVTYSSWLAAAARREFTIRAGLAATEQFEREHGAFDAQELAAAQAWVSETVERAKSSGTRSRRSA